MMDHILIIFLILLELEYGARLNREKTKRDERKWLVPYAWCPECRIESVLTCLSIMLMTRRWNTIASCCRSLLYLALSTG